MSNCCTLENSATHPRYRKILWIALLINFAMFFVELTNGFTAHSVSLLADAVDFFGDSINYALSLFVLALAPALRSKTALLKGMTMGIYGIFILSKAAWNATTGSIPEPITMGMIGLLALAANGIVALLLFAYRKGDANMRSVWLCTRNDVLGNIAVIMAAIGVFGTNSNWPDISVAIIMGILGITAAWSVIVHAQKELHANSR